MSSYLPFSVGSLGNSWHCDCRRVCQWAIRRTLRQCEPSGDCHPSAIAYPMERTQNQKRSLGNALSVLISCLLFGRETHASTTQSDPLLLPTRNGPCREDGALHWEYPFCRVQHPPP